MSNEKILDTEIIGEKVVDVENITPSAYFDYVKGLKEKLNREEYNIIIDSALKMIEKCKITRQSAMAKELAHQVDLALRELHAANEGFDIFVNRKVIEKYISDVEGKAIKIIELSEYTREIPEEVMDRVAKAADIFDQMYIVFTDYTKKESKRVAKERRDKDPILFGAFQDKQGDSKNKIYIEDRLFFIADWVDDTCDLTLEQIVRQTQGKSDEVLTYKVNTPEDFEQVKSYLSSFSKPIEENIVKPVKLFDKVKAAAKKATTRKKSTTGTATGAKRGRKKKSETMEE